MKSDRRQTILFIIILLVLGMGIGYAFLTTTLTIDGVSDIDSASWDVHFENVQVQSGSVTGDQVITPATISADGQTISYHIKLKEPGDNYVFKVDVVNSGSLDAAIDNILFKINGEDATMAPSYLAQYVMYDGYSSINIGDTLKSGQTKRIIAGIHYREDLNPEDLPTEDTSLTISFGLVYNQTEKLYYAYSVDEAHFLVGETVPDGVTLYDNYSAAINNFGHNMFLRYELTNNRLVQPSIGFIYNNNLYYLVGGNGATVYEPNKQLIMDLFNDGNHGCGNFTVVDSPVAGYSCYFDGFGFAAYDDGKVTVCMDSNAYCCYLDVNYNYCGVMIPEPER